MFVMKMEAKVLVEDIDPISVLFMKKSPAFVGMMMKGFYFLMWKTTRWDLGSF